MVFGPQWEKSAFAAEEYQAAVSARTLNATHAIQYVVNNAIKNAIANTIAGVVETQTMAAVENVQTVMQFYAKAIRNRPGTFRKFLTPIALEAQAATLAAFEGGGLGTKPYRANATAPNERYAGGRLAEALKSPNFFRVAADGIAFGNVLMLEAANRGYRRLNYGAGAGFSNPGLSISFLGASTPIDSISPIPSMFMPKGYWFQNEFYPLGYLKSQNPALLAQFKHSQTLGVAAKAYFVNEKQASMEGTHFLEAGITLLLEQMPAAIEAVLLEIAEEAVNQGTGPAAIRNVNATSLSSLISNI